MLSNYWKTIAASTVVACQLTLTLSAHAQSRSSWDSLPEEAVAAMRIPSGKALAEATSETKFGAVFFNEKRKQAVIKALESDDSGEWQEFQDQLEDYGFTTDDLIGLLAGESGYAVTISERGDDAPLFAGLAWLEPGEDLAGRIYEALAKLLEEQDEEHPIERVDLELADHPVMQLLIPEIEIEYEKDLDYDIDYEGMTEEEQEEAWEKAYQEWQDSAIETVVYHTLLITKHEGKLLVAHTYEPQDEEENSAPSELLSGLMSRWISAHSSDSEGFTSRLQGQPIVDSVMSLEGLSIFELLVDVKSLVKQLSDFSEGEEMAESMIRMFGLEGLGPLAIRSTVQGNQWHTIFGLDAPAPRQGFMQLLDQQQLAIDPPQWVPANIVRYIQWSFDLGQAYEQIKEIAMREFPQQAAAGFAMAEAQTQNFAQASLTDVLSSLGKEHTYISFGINPSENQDDIENMTERFAVVWQVEDEELWSRLLKAIAPFASMAPGTESAEEQGFSGWRMKNEGMEGGLFLGNGYLVLSVGSGVVESVLSSLNNPPTGTDAFRGSEMFAQAGELLDLQPAVGAEIIDGERYMGMVLRAMNTQLTQAATLMDQIEEDYEEGDNQLVLLMQAIMPTDDELKGIMGVIASRFVVNDSGFISEAVQEMPEK